MPRDQAIALLQECIGTAYEANVSVQSPQMRTAAALLSTLESAAAAEQSADAPPPDPYAEQLKLLFSDDYIISDDFDDEQL